MRINLSALIAELIPNRNQCGVIFASTALACLFYVKKRQESRTDRQRRCPEDNNNHMRSFVRNSQTVLKMISESSFSSDIELSCLSDCSDLSLDTSCQPSSEELDLYQSYFDDSFISGSTSNNKEFWQLTNISTCEADTQVRESHWYGLIQTEEGEISYIWEPELRI